MTSETMQPHDLAAPRGWSRPGGRLAAVVNITSRWSHKYPALEFESPHVFSSAAILNRSTLKWRGEDGAEVWLKVGANDHTIAVRLRSSSLSGKLLVWAIVNPFDGDVSQSGLIVGRVQQTTVVGKTTRLGHTKLTSRAICIVASADLTSKADGGLLSSLANGFSQAASDNDRDAWASWLWDQVSQGHLSSSYVTSLGRKVLGPHARKLAAGTDDGDTRDIATLLGSVGVFERGADYVLPSGLHAAVHVNLGAACGNSLVVKQLAARIKQLLDDSDYDTIVSTGWPTAVIGRQVVRLRPLTGSGVVRHCEYEGVPPLPLAPVARGSRVVVLTDVRITGRLIAQVCESVEAAGGCVVLVVAIVDGGGESERGDAPFRAVCRYDVQAVAPAACTRCGHLERREFNPVACCMTLKKEQPRSPAEFLNENREAADFWRQVDITRAYEHHRVEGNTHYLSFIDTERLLAHELVGPTLLRKLVAELPQLVGMPDVLLVPGKTRARFLAEKLLQTMASGDRLWPPDIVVAKQVNGRFQFSSQDAACLRGAKVLIVDTGVSHGATLDELYHLANSAGAALIAAAVIISRMSDSQEAAIAERFEGRFRRLYQVPIRPLSIPDTLRRSCPVCRRRDDIAKAAAESQFRPLLELLKMIRSRRGRRSAARKLQTASARVRQILLIAHDESPLLERCRRSTASGVTLHSLHAAKNNGMALLALPEICDDNIPASNRTAMLEYLTSSAWKWSSESLFNDARRLLDERDPDEVWTACAGFLNQSSCIYWIEALERRLVSNDSARQQRSKTVWNRLAFEVYSLLKSEPSYRSELWTRFAVMRRACLDTPAEEGISEIVKIVAETDTVATQTD